MKKSVRLLVGGLAHETHTFAATPTRVADFRAYEWAEGAGIVSAYQGTRTSLGGILDGAAALGATVVPTFHAFAIPSGIVPADDYIELRTRLLDSVRDGLAQHEIDGVILVCHGAMVAEQVEDVERDLAEHVRALIGPDLPLAMTLDYHGNVSGELVAACDLVDAYDTYPHVDVYERGYEAAEIVHEMVVHGIKLARAYASIPILAVPQRQNTDAEPMRSLLARVHEIERDDPAIRAISLLGGFCYSDIACAGVTVIVHAIGSPDRAVAYAKELQALVWERRHEFVQTNTPVAEAVAQIGAATDRPAMLVDVADNIGGGAPGDGTELLREIIAQQVTGAVVAIADAEAVRAAFEAGIGGQLVAEIGGKTDAFHGEPVAITGRVRLLSDGQFIYRGSYMTGQIKEMGRTAVVDVAGNAVILSEHKTMPFDQQQLRSVGITPEHCRAIVVKSATAWRAAYADLAGAVLEVDTPGICTANLPSLPYAHVTRPIFPLDDDAGIACPPVQLYQ
jgi:microcystin degradation protein MlrC